MIVPRYYENLNVLHENTQPARAYYVPASCRMDDLVEHREGSDRLQLLNGKWKFQYFKSIYDVKDAFYEMGYDTGAFDEIEVPGVWQMAGYDTHQYTNIRYPFPFDPPYVPQDIPCGAYVHTFSYAKDVDAAKAFLNFEGVDSCFYVWINGEYIGYSQVSHMTGEFDVTDILKEGENTIAVLVMKWCDGSYLEDQDKFRMSGIFRDVYILKRPECAIRDYRITTSVLKEKAEVKLDLSFYQETAVKVTIEDRNGVVVAEGQAEHDGAFTFEIIQPTLWNTENPYLYTLILQSENETIVDHIAVRTIEIKDKVIYFNGQKIKFRGVNRHDSDPVTGFTVDVEKIKKDLTLMKQHNFNAIRSSHYPNAPYFYQMCDKYGFMVCDEADIEAHGPYMLYRKEDTDYNRFKKWNEKIADNPEWEAAILDRVKRMVERDKNRFCIVMWSMGNESAYGCNFEKALAWTKQYDPSRITQYESARYRNYDVTYNYENLDLYSRMYPALSEIEEYLEKDGVLVVLDKTPFYAEMGGQAADHGVLNGTECSLRVLDVKKTPKGYYVHTCVLESGIVKVGDHLNAQVDKEYRMSVCRNHTATHLLQAALREVLGDHVHQAGSYQDAEITHFDFTHFSAVTPEELARVQKIVNDKIYESMNVTVKEMPIEEAKKLGAMALFGEKYGKVVRVVNIEGWSTEFCGGTHVKNTAQIGGFKIVSESSVAAGIRRIEAVTGRNLLVRANLQEAMLHTVANTLKANNITSLPIRAEAVMAENKAMSKELEEIKAKVAASKVSSLFDNAEEVSGVKIASAYFTGTTGDTLRGMCDSIRDKAVNPCVAGLVGKTDDKITMAVTVNKLAQEKGLKAGVLVKEISAIAGGKGGGKPDFAMAGLKDETKIDEALAAVKGIVEKQLG